mgnify:CR=1 FL=1
MNWRLAVLLTLFAVPGVIASSWLALPLLVDPKAIPVPLETIQIVTAAQGVVFVALATTLGAVLGQKVGLAAPALTAMISGGRVFEALRPQILPGFVGGAFGAVTLLGFYTFAPEALAQNKPAIPLAVRVLYGGITEEVLIRWGLMTVLVWIGWRVFEAGHGKASRAVVWAAITLSALLFGVAHVPSVTSILTTVSASVVVYIIAGNAVFGVLAGYLFWRFGLEAAISAHVLAHVLAYAVQG